MTFTLTSTALQLLAHLLLEGLDLRELRLDVLALLEQAGLVRFQYRQEALELRALVAQGKVIRPGRTLTVARAEVYADDGSHVATMLQTLMALPGRPDSPE